MIDTRVSHGMVLGSDNQKMSKSKGNVINPDDIVNEFGADTLRVYEMFMGDYEQDAPWSTESLRGCKRFIDRVVRLKDKVVEGTSYSSKLEVIINKSIKKISYDLLNMGYNTVVSQLMIMLNTYEEQDTITSSDYNVFLKLLNPIAPHITEELNEQIGYEKICDSTWPEYDESKTVDNNLTIGVQVNGKLRAEINITLNEDKASILAKAKEEENIKKYLEGHTIIKEIVVPNKIVNIVVK